MNIYVRGSKLGQKLLITFRSKQFVFSVFIRCYIITLTDKRTLLIKCQICSFCWLF